MSRSRSIFGMESNEQQQTTNETDQLLMSPSAGREYGAAAIANNPSDGHQPEDNAENTNNGNEEEEDEEEEEEEDDDDDAPANDRDATVERLTRRLRCLFSAITWPIVPLGTLVSFNLLWVLYAAFVLDARRTCSHPLHAYALASLLFLIYAPYHAQVRSYLFRYSRERDGPIRPTRVRLYDQLFHTLCILYVYGGVTLIQTCQGDVPSTTPSSSNSTAATAPPAAASLLPPPNTCETTCPHLYPALDLYVTALELFTLSLILPLLFLPCIYLWILRRASPDAETLLQDSLDEEDLFGSSRRQRGPNVSAHELMEALEPVKLTRSHEGEYMLESERTGELWEADDSLLECCICMSEFVVGDEETGVIGEDEQMVRTKCGHIFHRKCLAGWVGGRWDPSQSTRRRARSTRCPLCREDLRPVDPSANSTS